MTRNLNGSLLFCIISFFSSLGLSEQQSPYRHSENPLKWMSARSSVYFSPRYSYSTTGITPSDYMRTFTDFDASEIVWHYPKDMPNGAIYNDDLINLARTSSYGVKKFNCALPSTTRLIKSACYNSQGSTASFHGSSVTFEVNTDSVSFRNEVLSFLKNAQASGCTSLHQDNPMFMARETSGCVLKDEHGQILPLSEVQNHVVSYYQWLNAQIPQIFGKSIPMTFNKKFNEVDVEENSAGNMLAPYFTGVMAEVGSVRNNPYDLFHSIEEVNNQMLNETTSTTLLSEDTLKNQQHIATVYGVGGLPILPYDVYVGTNKPRYYGNPDDFRPYANMIKQNRSFFDGLGSLIAHDIDYNSSVHRSSNIDQALADQRRNVAMFLRANSADTRVLHVINWQGDRRFFTIYLDASVFSIPPATAQVITPENPTPITISVTYESANSRYKVTIPTFNVWSVVKFNNDGQKPKPPGPVERPPRHGGNPPPIDLSL